MQRLKTCVPEAPLPFTIGVVGRVDFPIAIGIVIATVVNYQLAPLQVLAIILQYRILEVNKFNPPIVTDTVLAATSTSVGTYRVPFTTSTEPEADSFIHKSQPHNSLHQ